MSSTAILLQQITYQLPNEKSIFQDLSLSFAAQKIGLIGRNGIGKSTLFKLMTKELAPQTGSVHSHENLFYLPQNPIIDNDTTIASFLGYEEKLQALARISSGSLDENDFALLNEEWDIEHKLQQQLSIFQLQHLSYNSQVAQLSGGERVKLFLTRAFASNADFILLDEPTNHLDREARQQLQQLIHNWSHGIVIISHDRELLQQMEQIIELTSLGAKIYGGNYEHYLQQKTIEAAAQEQQVQDAQKQLDKNHTSIQITREKHAHKRAQGENLRRTGSIDKLSANAARGRSERSQSKMLIKEQRLLKQAEALLTQAKQQIEIQEQLAIKLDATKVPNGKILVELDNLCFHYPTQSKAIIENFSLIIQGPARIALAGNNGSGKTTLVKLVLGELPATSGNITLGTERIRYLDQNASLLRPELSVLENFLWLNPEIKELQARFFLAQFLFRNVNALKYVKDLSGGEKLRALLACVLCAKQPPQLLILDEPSNHLDLTSLANVEAALKNFQGALLVISHDQTFLTNINIEKTIYAPFNNA